MYWSWDYLIKIGIALLLGGIIGLDRELHDKPAGLRTNMLVSLAAAIYVMAAGEAAEITGSSADVVRSMSAIATGIGFLGGGIILQSKGRVRMVTTAASLWAAAAIGYSVGMGLYVLASVATVAVFLVLQAVSAVRERFWPRTGSDNGHLDF
ncbi:MAG: MgtC/SapB family protein [Anaerolineales bacterium]